MDNPLDPFTRLNFGPAHDGESRVFGSQSPQRKEAEWLRAARHFGIDSVIVLTTHDATLQRHQESFTPAHVLHAPIEDYHYGTEDELVAIVQTIDEWLDAGRRIVLHCEAGRGRTGHVLAAWVFAGLNAQPMDGDAPTPERAIELVSASGGAVREPREAASSDGPLEALLWRVRRRIRP